MPTHCHDPSRGGLRTSQRTSSTLPSAALKSSPTLSCRLRLASMGRINLAALRVRKRALETYVAKIETSQSTGKKHFTGILPGWVDIVADIPPAQIFTRQQPHQHSLSQIRTRSLPGSSKTQQYATVAAPSRKPKSGKASRLFAPIEIKYEEDELRRQFFSDHPWELARPRIVLETTGDQYSRTDWSTGLLQPGIPLSGESVIQRQLWLLQNVPDITIPQAYDVARQEFYTLRRAEETKRRIAIEEAEHMGAEFNKTANQWGMEIENKMYDDWEKWSKAQILEQMAKNSAIAGETNPVEQDVLEDNHEAETQQGQRQGQGQGQGQEQGQGQQGQGQRRANRLPGPFEGQRQRQAEVGILQ